MAVKTCTVICNDKKLSVTPGNLVLVVKKPGGNPDDEGAWLCNDGDVDIIFNKGGGHPWTWASNTAPQGQATNFGAPSVKHKKTYAYTLVIHRAGQADITLDPTVEVDEGGPPGGKKKAAKKRSVKKKM